MPKFFNMLSDQNLLKLIQKYQSPLYVYEEAKIESQYTKLSNAFKKLNKVRFHYAVKANNNINILKIIKKLGGGLDTVSIQEVMLGLKAGFDPKDIIYTPNGVSIEEIERAVEEGVKINIDNLSILEHFTHKFPDYPVGVRINPHIMAGGNSNISVGHIDSKFGISIHQLPHILRIAEVSGQKIEGLHMHTGSDILDVDVFLQGAEILLNMASEFDNLEYIDFGSGFKVPYRKGDPETDIEYLGNKLTKRFSEFRNEHGKELELKFEPGKYLVSESGSFLVRVNSIKQTTANVFAAVDSGFNHLIRPMFYNAYHEIENISNPKGRLKYYTVVGYICETDTFASDRAIPEISEGDILRFKNAGAYSFTMASNYNSRYRPAEVLVNSNGEDFLIREREDFEDITRKMLEIPE